MRRTSLAMLYAAAIIFTNVPEAPAGEPKAHIQPNISAGKIFHGENGFTVEISILATDFEEMFQKHLTGLRGIDLSAPGILELEIGKFVSGKVVMRDAGGAPCRTTVEKAGEDPSNDEGVQVLLRFECATKNIVYDAMGLLTALGPRAWQVVTILRGTEASQVMINADSPPIQLAR